MDAATKIAFRDPLLERKRRLKAVVSNPAAEKDLGRLLGEIDAALARIDDGTFGLCENCHDAIEADRLAADPLVRFCLDHLTVADQRALERDLELAAKIQGALLPGRDARCAGFEIHYRYAPHGPVSGDYCDLVEAKSGDGEVFALVGDVSGKGVAASIVMAQLHATIRTLIDVGLPVGELLARANRIFCESVLASHYATLACVRARGDGRVDVANAGHPPVLHLSHGVVERIDATGLPLGVLCDGSFMLRSFEMGPGDALVLYTDGVTETRGPDGSEYGPDRLTSLIGRRSTTSAAALVAACLDDVESFRGGTARPDDLTLMVIRRL